MTPPWVQEAVQLSGSRVVAVGEVVSAEMLPAGINSEAVGTLIETRPSSNALNRTGMSATTSCMAVGMTPGEYASLLPSPPAVSSAGRGWRGLTLQQFHLGPTDITYPAAADHRLAVHLSGPTLVEQACDGRRGRRWSDSGCVNLVPAGMPVTKVVKGQPNLLLLHIDPSSVDQVVSELELDPARVSLVPCLCVPDGLLDRVGRLLLTEAEATSDGLGSQLLAETLARSLVLHLVRRFSSLAPQGRSDPGEVMVGWRLRRTIEYMHANLSESLPLAELAAVSGLSPTHFTRAFRLATGDPPYRHFVRLRIEKARELLECSTLSINEVAIRCGFEQPSHFASMFRKLTGVSPRAFRRARCT